MLFGSVFPLIYVGHCSRWKLHLCHFLMLCDQVINQIWSSFADSKLFARTFPIDCSSFKSISFVCSLVSFLARKFKICMTIMNLENEWICRFLKDTVYDTVAANRYTVFGKTRECRLSDASYQDRFIEQWDWPYPNL